MASRTQADNKTQPVKRDVRDYLDTVTPAGRREDAFALLAMMEKITGEKAVLWGTSIVGFGQYHYVYESGREGDHMLTGFAPRKANMVVYVMPGFDAYGDLLDRLGRHKTGASCLYLGRLSGVDEKVLTTLIDKSVKHMRRKYKVPKPK